MSNINLDHSEAVHTAHLTYYGDPISCFKKSHLIAISPNIHELTQTKKLRKPPNLC